MTGRADGAFDRDTALARMSAERFDVLVVGGGITGAGVALDAASRGLRTALVERADFASGTSSQSSKLVHGGLRYLAQRDYGLVHQALAERRRLLANAPHLVRPLPFLYPAYGGRAASRAVGTALWMYDLAGGARIGRVHRRLPVDAATAHLPTLRTQGLAAGYLFYDAWADDARLTLAVARTAVLDHGAVAANYVAVTGLFRDGDGRVTGAAVRSGGDDLEVRAEVVVNAGGVWSDEVRALEEGSTLGDGRIRPAKGIHVTVPADRLPTDLALVLPVPEDGRSIFVVPWPGTGRVYVGTTDTDYDGPLDRPTCTADDVDYLLRAVNASVIGPLTRADVVGAWAGLRPLAAGAAGQTAGVGSRSADLSRRHRLSRSTGGVVSVTGGKLTTYRRMAADTVDQVVEVLGRGGRTRTARLRLRGAGQVGRGGGAGAGHLEARYGAEAGAVRALVTADPDLGRPLVPSLPYLRAEAVHAVRAEMARSVTDVLARRTRALILAGDASAAAAGDVARLLAPELGWTEAEAAAQAAAYRDLVAAERAGAGLPEASRK